MVRSKFKPRRKTSRRSSSTDSGAVALVLIVILVWYFFIRDDSPDLDPSYEAQLNRLVEIQQSVETLTAFVNEQEMLLKERQELVTNLEAEATNLKMTIETQRPIVDAILDAQAAKWRRDRWIERGVSFVLGILASILGNAVWKGLSRRHKPAEGS